MARRGAAWVAGLGGAAGGLAAGLAHAWLLNTAWLRDVEQLARLQGVPAELAFAMLVPMLVSLAALAIWRFRNPRLYAMGALIAVITVITLAMALGTVERVIEAWLGQAAAWQPVLLLVEGVGVTFAMLAYVVRALIERGRGAMAMLLLAAGGLTHPPLIATGMPPVGNHPGAWAVHFALLLGAVCLLARSVPPAPAAGLRTQMLEVR